MCITWPHGYIYIMHTSLLANLQNMFSMSTFTFPILFYPSHHLNFALHQFLLSVGTLTHPSLADIVALCMTQHGHAAQLPPCKSTEYMQERLHSYSCMDAHARMLMHAYMSHMHACSLCMHINMHAQATSYTPWSPIIVV